MAKKIRLFPNEVKALREISEGTCSDWVLIRNLQLIKYVDVHGKITERGEKALKLHT